MLGCGGIFNMENEMTDILLAIGLIALVVGWIIFGPLCLIWSLNTLFHTGIPYTFTTWLATLVLWSVLFTTRSRK